MKFKRFKHRIVDREGSEVRVEHLLIESVFDFVLRFVENDFSSYQNRLTVLVGFHTPHSYDKPQNFSFWLYMYKLVMEVSKLLPPRKFDEQCPGWSCIQWKVLLLSSH